MTNANDQIGPRATTGPFLRKLTPGGIVHIAAATSPSSAPVATPEAPSPVVVQMRAGANKPGQVNTAAPSTNALPLLNTAIDLATLPFPLVRFPSLKRTRPELEDVVVGTTALVEVLAPTSAPVVAIKDDVPYYIAGRLNDAPLVGRTLKKAQEQGRPIVGKQRSRNHIASLGPALLLDVDGSNVFDRAPLLASLGAWGLLYGSFSYGLVKQGVSEPSLGGRCVVVGDRTWTVDEHRYIWAGANDLLGAVADPGASGPAHCFGMMVRRSADKVPRRQIVQGAALSVDGLVARGRLLLSFCDTPRSSGSTDAFTLRQNERELVARVEVLGRALPPNTYDAWVRGAPAFRRWRPDDVELAARLFDTWSAAGDGYAGSEVTRVKFNGFADTDEHEHTATVDGLSWAARRRSEAVLVATRGDVVAPARVTSAGNFGALGPRPRGFDRSQVDPDSIVAGIYVPRPPEVVDSAYATPERVEIALNFLVMWWPPEVLDVLVQRGIVSATSAEAARGAVTAAREERQLDGRVPMLWSGTDLNADTERLAAQVVRQAAGKLFEQDGRVVEVHLGDADAPASSQPIDKLSSARAMVGRYVAVRREDKNGSAQISSPQFRSSMRIEYGPDQLVLQDLMNKVLPERLPKLRAIVTAPALVDLSIADDAAVLGRVRVIDKPGYDAASALFYAPDKGVPSVSPRPSQQELNAALTLIREVLRDFSFGSQEDYGRALFAMLVAANRPILETAPGFAIGASAQGQSVGKTTLSSIFAVIASGRRTSPVALPSTFEEQEKKLHALLMRRPGALFIDNIVNGMRADSSALATIITEPVWSSRTLGQSAMRDVSTRVLVLLNGNAINLAGDLASRFVLIAMAARTAHTKYQHPNIVEWVLANRMRIIVALHTALLAYIEDRRQNGVPAFVKRTCSGTSRFGAIVDTLRHCVVWVTQGAYGDPFGGFTAALNTSSTHAEAAEGLMIVEKAIIKLAAISQATAVKAADVLSLIDFTDRETLTTLTGSKGGKLSAITLGRWMRSCLLDAPISGRTLRAFVDRKEINRFWIE